MTDQPLRIAPLRIAMWSGPRNISTAMMRAWENRPDSAVWDEPFYAYYLSATGLDHPIADAVIAAGETDWRKVVAAVIGPPPNGRRIFYQKHMTHHLLPEIDRGWLRQVQNCFLIRDPAEVLASYAAKRSEVPPSRNEPMHLLSKRLMTASSPCWTNWPPTTWPPTTPI